MPKVGGGGRLGGGAAGPMKPVNFSIPIGKDALIQDILGFPSMSSIRRAVDESSAESLARFILTQGEVPPNSRISRILGSTTREVGGTLQDFERRSKTFLRRTGEYIPPEVIQEMHSQRLAREAKGALPAIVNSPGELTHILARFFAGNQGELNLLESSRLLNQLEAQGIKSRKEPSVPAFVYDVASNVYSGLRDVPGWSGKHSWQGTVGGVSEALGLPSQRELEGIVVRVMPKFNIKPPKFRSVTSLLD